MSRLVISNSSFIYLLTILSVILTYMSEPYITPYLIGSIYVVISSFILVILMISFIFYGGFVESDNWNKLIYILASFSILHGALLFIYYVSEGGIDGLRFGIGLSAKYLMLLPVCWILTKRYNLFLNLLWYSNCIIILSAVLLFFLFLFGIELPYIEFSPDGRPHYFFYIGATNVILHFGNSFFIRTAGFCDEPGQLALVITHLLILNEFTYKKNSNRIFLVISAIFTSSFAFFITVIPIIIYWLRIGLFRLKALCKVIALGILFIGAIYLNITKDLAKDIELAAETLIFNRFETDGDGSIKGNNRSASLPMHIEALKEYPVLGMNACSEIEYSKYNLGGSTFIGGLAKNGIIFSIIYYLPFFILLFKFRTNNRYWLFLSLGLNFLQRPGLSFMLFLVIYSLIYYSKYYGYQKKNSNF